MASRRWSPFPCCSSWAASASWFSRPHRSPSWAGKLGADSLGASERAGRRIGQSGFGPRRGRHRHRPDTRRPGGARRLRRPGGGRPESKRSPPPHPRVPAGDRAGAAADRPADPARARRRRGHVHPAVPQGPRAGRPHLAAHQGQRRGHRRAAAGVRRVRRRLRGHRLQPRPDGDPLRGDAGPGREGGADHQPDPQHRLRGEERRGAHPQPDPGQERGRRRDPQRRPRGRHARRRAARAGRAA